MRDLTIEDKKRILRSIIIWACHHNNKCDYGWCSYTIVPTIKVNGWEFETNDDDFPMFSGNGRYQIAGDRSSKYEECPLPDMKFDEFTNEQLEKAFDSIPQQFLIYSHEAMQELWLTINDMTKIYQDKDRSWECI